MVGMQSAQVAQYAEDLFHTCLLFFLHVSSFLTCWPSLPLLLNFCFALFFFLKFLLLPPPPPHRTLCAICVCVSAVCVSAVCVGPRFVAPLDPTLPTRTPLRRTSLRRTPSPPPDRPKFRSFFPSPTTIFFLSFSLFGVLPLNFGGVFEARGFTRQPENSKRAHLRGPGLQNTTQIPREDPQRREKKE